MEEVKQKLTDYLQAETARVKPVFNEKDVMFPVIEVIRSLDYNTFVISQYGNIKDGELLMEKYRYGWGLAFSMLYKDLKYDDFIPLFKYNEAQRKWVDSLIQHCGKIQLSTQMIDYTKSGLLDLYFESPNKFIFSFNSSGTGVELFEKRSLNYYHKMIRDILKDKIEEYEQKLPLVRENLRSIVNVQHNDFISYNATDETDRFYSRAGYLYLMTTQVIDEFAENDTFGCTQYRDYLDIAEYIFRSALMHRDCCIALILKSDYKVSLKNIITYALSRKKFINSLSNYLDWSNDKLSEVISCFTMNQSNFEYHLAYPGAPAAPYIQLGYDTLMRSDYGSMTNPIFFLNRELKRRYSTDYFNAVNNRETRMKNQLYDLFPQERIIKIYPSIKIKKGGTTTDIDAVLYDKDRNTLGLFQLKWQDVFSTSMKERYSRISNLIPKSVVWIDKIMEWIKGNDARKLLQTLRIDVFPQEIKEIYIFVIARNHVNFTNQSLDKRAVWASWYQLLEAHAKVKDPSCANPIAELAAKLIFFSPANRADIESAPTINKQIMNFPDYEIHLSSFAPIKPNVR